MIFLCPYFSNSKANIRSSCFKLWISNGYFLIFMLVANSRKLALRVLKNLLSNKLGPPGLWVFVRQMTLEVAYRRNIHTNCTIPRWRWAGNQIKVKTFGFIFMHFLNIHKLIRQDISRVGNLGAMLVPVSGAISCHLKEMKYLHI